VTPKVGIRGTAYSKSGMFTGATGGNATDIINTPSGTLDKKGAIFRPVANYGLTVSTKFSRTFEQVQSRWFGLDGLRHVVEPYMNYSGVNNMGPSPEKIYQFDRVTQTSLLPAIEFPQFTAIDSIDSWSITRFGVSQRLQTRRDNTTYQWFSLNTFMDANMENPYSDAPISNLFNALQFSPVPWTSLAITSQLPLEQQGFTEVNTALSLMPSRNVKFSIGHRYIQDNDYFPDNSQLNFNAYWRVNDHWSVSAYEQYEYVSKVMQYQRYFIHRDLSSWIASFGAEVRESEGGEPQYGFMLMMTLKDAPQITLPLNFSQSTTQQQPAGAVP
jgi:hypothetical protein